MKVLVLGGTRFTGPFILKHLIERGCEVTVFHRGRSRNPLPPGVSEILGDLKDLPEFTSEFRRVAPDVVLHTMAFTEQDATAFVETFRGIARRSVAISSIDVYRAFGRLGGTEPGDPDPAPLAEESPLREKVAVDPGEYDKIRVERVVMNEPDLTGTVLRYPAVYGPNDGQRRLFPFLKRMDDGRPVILLEEGLARWRFAHGYAEDVALAAALAVLDERAAGRIYHVAERDTPGRAEWVRMIARVAGWDGEVIAAPNDRLPEHLRNDMDVRQQWSVDSSRIRRELDYEEIVPTDESLRRTVEWERAHPPEKIDPAEFDYAAEDAALAALGHSI
jgi:nucleoside-diphosphate-sugar epimerase